MGFKGIAKVDRTWFLGCDLFLEFKGGGEEEVNVLNEFKKNVVPRKTRSLTGADNIVEEPVAVELAKSISLEDQCRQQCDIMTQLTINRQIDKDVEDTAAHNKYYEFENISATDSEATQDSSSSDTDEERDDETDDFDDFDMDLSKDKPKRDDNVAGFKVQIDKDVEDTYAERGQKFKCHMVEDLVF
nr:hypothetical protein [Tanacetum cinerariifolium]